MSAAAGRARPVTPGDLALAGAAHGRVAHLVIRRGDGLHWSSKAACGAMCWTQGELDDQLAHPPRLAGRPRCGAPWCVALWPVYDVGRR